MCVPCVYPVPCVFSLVTDASGKEICGVLEVLREGEWQPAAFYSRQLRDAEQGYSATELEALALVSAVEHFAYYLYGNSFMVYTDHKPLEHLLISESLNPHLRHMAYKPQHWLIRISYIPGAENTLANALSREKRRWIPDKLSISLVAGDVKGQPPQIQKRVEKWQQPLEIT